MAPRVADAGGAGPPRPLFEAAAADLERIRDDCAARQDRNAYFAAMYGRVTLAVRQRADAGRFEDPARMERFVAAFARRYTDAFWARRSGRATTRAWALAFDSAGQAAPLVLQHLLLGMNAHINLDLGIVAAELAREESSLRSLEGDFVAINDVLGELVDRCQQAVAAASPAVSLADRLLGDVDERATAFSLRVAREGAWEFAQRLYTGPQDRWPQLVEARDASVTRIGARLLTQAGPADVLQRLMRVAELRTVAEVTELLSGVDVS